MGDTGSYTSGTQAASSRLDSLTHFVDFLKMRLYRYLVNFGFGDQYQILTALRRPSWGSTPGCEASRLGTYEGGSLST